MIELVALALALLSQPQEMATIRVFGREMSGLHNRQDIIRGICDGHPASVTITKAYRGAAGRVVLRAGRWRRELPTNFLNGSLLSSGLKSAELACDGRRVQLSGLAIRADAHGDLIMVVQNAILDLRTGDLSLTELRSLSPAQTREELN